MSVDQVDAAHLAGIVGNVKVAIGDVMQVKVKKVAPQANLLPRSEAGLAVAAALLLLHKDIVFANIAIGGVFFDRRSDWALACLFG